MSKPKTATVEYFPHSVNHGKSMFALEAKYGNNGYAFWFKILEILGATEHHYIDCNDTATFQYLIAKTKTDDETATEIINYIVGLGCLDADFWKCKIIWSQKFVDNMEELYSRRTVKCYTKAELMGLIATLYPLNGINVYKQPQSKVKYSKVEKSKENHVSGFEEFWQLYPKKEAKQPALTSWNKINPDDELFAVIIEAVNNQRKTDKWQRENGKYIPMPATWLNQRRWEDQTTVVMINQTDEEIEKHKQELQELFG